MSEENKDLEKELADTNSKVLIEKVRELEDAKKEQSLKSEDKENSAKILHERLDLTPPMDDAEAKKAMSKRSRRGFLIGGATALAGVFGWRWMSNETKNSLLRHTLQFNEKVAQIFYSPKRLAPVFSKAQITEARINGGEGLNDDFDPATWKLQIVGLANPKSYSQYKDSIAYDLDDEYEVSGDAFKKPNNQSMDNSQNAPQSGDAPDMPLAGLLLTIDDIKKLPRTEMTTELKCIEGWSIVVSWAGVRFSDFMAKFQPRTKSGNDPNIANNPQDLAPYVAMITPNQGYYVGLDMPSMMHPQTLLAYEMNGAPLAIEHGAPLRLVTPTKYGIKHIKRIGRIEFTTERPPDFWAEQGYDWYSGH